MKLVNIVYGLTIILLFSLAVFSQNQPRAEEVHSADAAISDQLRKDGVKYETKRAVLWVEKGSLTQQEIEDFGALVEQGIAAIEKYTGVKFDKKYYKTEKMEYFIGGKIGISRGSIDQTPYIYLTSARVKEKTAPYLHETVHKIVYKSLESLWLQEGFATYIQTVVAGKNGGYDANPFNPKNADIDNLAGEILKTDVSKKLLPLIGLNGSPSKMTDEQREIYRPIFEDRRVTAPAFYILSTSFVKFLIEKVGVKKLEKTFVSADTRGNIFRVTGKTIEDWKAEWLKTLV